MRKPERSHGSGARSSPCVHNEPAVAGLLAPRPRSGPGGIRATSLRPARDTGQFGQMIAIIDESKDTGASWCEQSTARPAWLSVRHHLPVFRTGFRITGVGAHIQDEVVPWTSLSRDRAPGACSRNSVHSPLCALDTALPRSESHPAHREWVSNRTNHRINTGSGTRVTTWLAGG